MTTTDPDASTAMTPTCWDVADDRITWTGDGETIVVQSWGKDSVRVRTTRAGAPRDDTWALLPPSPVQAQVSVRDMVATLHNGDLTVTLVASEHRHWQSGQPRHRCEVSFFGHDGKLLLQERSDGGALSLRARQYEPLAGESYRISLELESDADEVLVGMGLYQQEVLDLKGCTLELAHRNSVKPSGVVYDGDPSLGLLGRQCGDCSK